MRTIRLAFRAALLPVLLAMIVVGWSISFLFEKPRYPLSEALVDVLKTWKYE